ncbi:hypothetical protein U9M48_040427 [Paspalum notatum var. saurae]|uniref:Uncharacterized protein n=1 Tax=Paspalum notatum var. saurae TaxID=547442 RepID=A0AAQ3UR19_PASNO
MGGDGSEEVVQRRGTRRSHYVNPPPISAAADKKLIKQIGDSQWEDVTWNGTGHRRTPNGLLDNLIRVHNPGVVEKMKYYYVNLSEQDHASKVFENAASKICKDLFSNLRIQPVPYKALCDMWPSEEFQERSSCGDRRVAECRRHAKYGKEMERLHSEGFDWRTAPVDPQTLYESDGGKSHGRYSMFNGMIDSRQVERRFSSQSSAGSSSRQPRTTFEMEIDSVRLEIQKRDAFLKAQKEYQNEQQAHTERLHAQQMGLFK